MSQTDAGVDISGADRFGKRHTDASSVWAGLRGKGGFSGPKLSCPACANMPRIKTDLLTAGMIVARDVANMDGVLLIPAGSTLSDRQIEILQAWGVSEVEVRVSDAVPDPDPLAHLSAEAVAEMKAELNEIFWRPSDSNPVFQEIFHLLLCRKARKERDLVS